MDSLPNELILRILGELLDDTNPLASYPALCAATRVCKRFTDPATELLYTYVDLSSRARSDSFHREGGRWRNRILRLDDRFAASQSMIALQESLSGCTRLESLTLGLSSNQLPVLESPSLKSECAA